MQGRNTFAFDPAVINGGNPLVTINAYRAGVAVALDLPFVGDPPIQVDGTASIRRSATFVIADEDGTLTPRVPSDPLAPYGTELQIMSGWTYADGSTEQIPMGLLWVTAAQAGLGQVTLTCQDRAHVLTEARFEAPWPIADGTSLTTAISDLLWRVNPNWAISAEQTADYVSVPATTYEEGDRSGNPWQNMCDLASKYGYETFFSPDGSLVLRKVPDPLATPAVWDYKPGVEALVLSTDSQLNSQTARNVAIVVGEGPEIATPIRSSVEITDPANPLYPPNFGYRAPVFFSSPKITTQAQADDAALSLLQRHAGGSELLGFTAAPHVAHDAGDIVRVENPVLNGGEAFVVLESFAMPITSRGAVTYRTTARRATT